MPQASLFSYFSKSVTSALSIPPTTREDDNITPDHDACVRVPNSPGLGIIEAARKQASQRPTNPIVYTLKAEEDEVESRRSEDVSQESKQVIVEAKDPSSDRLQQFDAVSIPHLPKALVAPVTAPHLPAIQRLTATTLPIRYSDAFFTTTLTDPIVNKLSRVVLYASQPVGWIRCRLEPCSPNSSLITPSPPSKIYIQALALLSPYRGLGLATLLLDTILCSASAQAADTVCIYAHVWEKNEDALEWYAKRGFKRVMLVDHYYRKLRPSGAWIVRKELEGT
ncbi:uncharacterized protein PV07_07337 [Cladophialophora immunda]|uniref:N-acetyltransferase domain-containing protein n=1 Tax=Cladophialophora immunda TaxID=569365 RepID=A0A0D1ZI24_9EURO|nr:uncharacterized protein PV07_07337 [Cladophialophora immunda]KIW27611.1 hypothetical protein PV07_07337 [Cladophialophora immunda]OQU97335.1 hypothetical protein CLAIMM_03281 [Cladophialophora immunda]